MLTFNLDDIKAAESGLLEHEFISRCTDNIRRNGLHNLIDYLYETDFFYAPCSTRFHLSEPHGLIRHSLAVHNYAKELFDLYSNFTPESVAIVSLFHDLCKVHCYNPCKKARKTGRKLPNGRDEWEDYTGYDFVEEFPYGHGEKSVYLIQKHIDLSDAEAMAIRWHMGFSDASFKGGQISVSNAMAIYPEIALLHSADMISTAYGL